MLTSPEVIDWAELDESNSDFGIEEVLVDSEMTEAMISMLIDWILNFKKISAEKLAKSLKVPIIDKYKDLPDMLNPNTSRLYLDTKTGKIFSTHGVRIAEDRFKLFREPLTSEQIREKAARESVVKYLLHVIGWKEF